MNTYLLQTGEKTNQIRYIVRMKLIFNRMYKKQQLKIVIYLDVLAAECRLYNY